MKLAGPPRSLAYACVVIAALGCGSDYPVPSGTFISKQQTVALSPERDSIAVGEKTVFSAEVARESRESSEDVKTFVTWTSSNPDVVTVGNDGVALAVGVGSAHIIASTEDGAADSSLAEVYRPSVLLGILPNAASMYVGDELQLKVDESREDAEAESSEIEWTSTNPRVATVTESGRVKAIAVGAAEIEAVTAGAQKVRAKLEIKKASVASAAIVPSISTLQVGGKARLGLSAFSSSGRQVGDSRPASWETSDSNVVVVDDDGSIRARSPGTATVKASIEAISTTALIRVTDLAASNLRLTPTDLSLYVGENGRLEATATDANGAIVQNADIAWQSSDSKVATVGSSGSVSAVSKGVATISAFSGEAFASARVVVNERAAVALQIVPANPTVLEGNRVKLVANAVDQNGNALSGRSFSWTSNGPQIAQIAGDGMLTGISEGTTTITAASGGLSKTVSVRVSRISVDKVSLSPSSASVEQGSVVPLTAVAKDQSGNAIAGRVVSWASSDPSIAAVDAQGRATGMAPGHATITATVERSTAKADIVVRASSARVADLDIVVNSPSLAVSQTTQASVIARDAGGRTLNGVPVSWSSSDPTIATVSNSGLVTAVRQGKAWLIAKSGSAVAEKAIVVTGAPTSGAVVASVTVILSSTQVQSGKTVTSTVTLKDSKGVVLTGRSISYSSTNNAVATVSPSGVVTGVSQGEVGIKAKSGGVEGTAWLEVTGGGSSPITRLTVKAPSTTLNKGTTMQAIAELYDGAGNRVTGPVTWKSNRTSVATITSGGVVTAVNAGSATLTATAANGVSGSLGITVTGTVPAAVAAVGATLGNANLVVGQTTQLSAVARDAAGNALAGHNFTYSSSNTSVATITSSGTVKAIKAGTAAISATASNKVGSAFLTVTSSSTNPPPTSPPPTTPPPTSTPPGSAAAALAKIGPTRSPSAAQSLGGGWAQYDPLWTKWEQTRWQADGSRWGDNYYDRAQIYYAQWIRTGNAAYKTRGDAMALDYRRNYLHASNYAATGHWSQLDGVALHYWINGDDSSRIAVGRTAHSLMGTALFPRTGPYTDARQQARTLIAMLLAWQMNAPNAPSGGWSKALDDGLNAILPQQSSDGAWRYPQVTCDLSLNYMGAMLSDALIRVYTSYRQDPRIPSAVKRTADFLWTQWRAGDATPSFNYYEAQCNNQHGNGGPNATGDLTGLFVTTYAWLASQDASYRSKADAVFGAAMKGMYPQASKQFNQAFAFGWRALGYLP